MAVNKKRKKSLQEETEKNTDRSLLETGMEAESFLEYASDEKSKPKKKRAPTPVDIKAINQGHSGESLLRMKGEEDIKKAEKIIDDRMPKEKKKRIRKILKIVLFVLLLGGSLAVVYPLVMTFMDDTTEAATLEYLFQNMNVKFAVLAILCTVILIVIGGLRHAYITRVTSKQFRPLKCTRIFLLGKFYDNVTPLATGGQPFEIYELNKMGIPGGTATAIPLIRYFIQMFTVTPFSLLLFIFYNKALNTLSPAMATTMSVFAYIGMGVFLIIPVFLIFVTIMPKFGMRMAAFFIRIGAKLKIVRNYDKTIQKAAKMVSEFKVAMKYVTSKPLHLLFLFFITVIETVITYIVPFFLCVAFGNTLPTWELLLQTTTLNAYAFFAVSFMPTPGNAGFAESVFTLMFTGVKFGGNNPLVWVVLMWRFLTYYIFILIGLLIILYDIIKGRIVKHRKKVNMSTLSITEPIAETAGDGDERIGEEQATANGVEGNPENFI